LRASAWNGISINEGAKPDYYRLNTEVYMKQKFITAASVASFFTGFALLLAVLIPRTSSNWGEVAAESTTQAILIVGGLLSLAISNSSNSN
jgi:hypothetical protein